MFRPIFIAALAFAPVAAHAQDRAASDAPVLADPFAAAAVTDGDLGAATGREDIARQVATANQRNTVSGNSVVGNSVTGGVAIDGNAFQNLSGLSVISANSGNNVAINSAMNVVVNLAPTR
jgi:phosphodiesterase/alkaline phosphatase D-like protein